MAASFTLLQDQEKKEVENIPANEIEKELGDLTVRELLGEAKRVCNKYSHCQECHLYELCYNSWYKITEQHLKRKITIKEEPVNE